MPVRNPLDREIARLAVPALGALLAEPLFLLTDTALVGHLGAVPLGGLGIASVILSTAVGLLVFLAYATTPIVARRLGSGDLPGAIRAGIDGLWLSVLIGAGILVAGLLGGRALVELFGATPEVSEAASTYLLISAWGLPAMLLVLAATGLLRGLQDTRTPLVVAGVGFLANALLNALFIYGFGWGIAGSAIGTVIAQWGMAAVYLVIAARAAARTGVSLKPGFAGVRGAAASGGWLLLRTASLRLALLATVVAGTQLGVTELATLQIALTIYSTLAFGLDALAIAGQAMIGHGLGASDIPRVTAVTRRLTQLGVVGGIGLGIVIAAVSPVAAPVFTGDAAIQRMLPAVLIVLAVGIPLAGYVFVLDGVLIGAGDARYLALSGLTNVAVYLPLLALATAAGTLTAVWTAFGIGFIGARALTLGLRARGTRWIVTGAR
ncbi:MATE family efflux transporter [Marisediminicola senii]|uniref:MATE family efflux transporter n=1 Tax=Marisediminicola senii TaxID=2711233 RepID=UPI0013EDA5E2|nr:MATE family efflux transporter [Marisediminicola senii]